MLKNFRDKIALSGITVLMIGVTLLILTFISAYGFLSQSLSIIASEDMVRTFGEALAPLIATCIHIMYLGIMGWVGSLLTIRGVNIIAHAPQIPTAVPQQQPTIEQKPQLQPQPQKPKVEKPKAEKPKEEKPKEEVKPPEPEFLVIPPETATPPQPQPEQKQEPQKNNSAQQPPN